MRQILARAVLLALAVPGAAFAAQAPEGVWTVAGDAAKIRIAPCPGQAEHLCGTIVSVKPRAPDKAAAARPAPEKVAAPKPAASPKSPIGQTLMVGFKPSGANKWNGKFQFGGGKSLGAVMSVNKDGTLHVGACILAICKGQDWKRAS